MGSPIRPDDTVSQSASLRLSLSTAHDPRMLVSVKRCVNLNKARHTTISSRGNTAEVGTVFAYSALSNHQKDYVSRRRLACNCNRGIYRDGLADIRAVGRHGEADVRKTLTISHTEFLSQSSSSLVVVVVVVVVWGHSTHRGIGSERNIGGCYVDQTPKQTRVSSEILTIRPEINPKQNPKQTRQNRARNKPGAVSPENGL